MAKEPYQIELTKAESQAMKAIEIQANWFVGYFSRQYSATLDRAIKRTKGLTAPNA